MTRNQFLRYVFWEWVEPIGVALGIALLIMHYVTALYVIPTGSMQPTLHGKGDYGQGDKVLVNKFLYRFEPPKRWDVFVFEYPFQVLYCKACDQDLFRDHRVYGHIGLEDDFDVPAGMTCPSCGGKPALITKDYIKRCVGLPGDELLVHDGDLLRREKGAWRFLPKTAEAQAALWVPVWSLAAAPGDLWTCWEAAGGRRPEAGEDGLLFAAGGERTLSWRLPDALRGRGDRGLNRGAERRDGHAPQVGDLELAVRLAGTAPAAGTLRLDLLRGDDLLRGEVDFTARSCRLLVNGAILREAPLPAGVTRVAFRRLDGRLGLEAGDLRLDEPLPGLEPGRNPPTERVTPRLSWAGDALALADLSVRRDIFYLPPYGDDPVMRVPKDGFWAMGDNSWFSADSREWGHVPARHLIGKAMATVLPFGRIGLIE